MSKRFTSKLVAGCAALSLTLTACASEDSSNSADETAALGTTAAETGQATDTLEPLSPEEEANLPDLTHRTDFELLDGSAWPATVLGHTIRTQEELQQVANENPDVAGWALNWDMNSIEGMPAKELTFDELQAYGKEVCEKYPQEKLAQFVEDPYGQPADEMAFDQDLFDEHFEEHYPYPYPIPDEHMAQMWMNVHTAAIYASCGDSLPPLELNLNPENIEGTQTNNA